MYLSLGLFINNYINIIIYRRIDPYTRKTCMSSCSTIKRRNTNKSMNTQTLNFIRPYKKFPSTLTIEDFIPASSPLCSLIISYLNFFYQTTSCTFFSAYQPNLDFLFHLRLHVFQDKYRDHHFHLIKNK